MKILCIGNCTRDFTIPVAGFPIENNKYRIQDKVINIGGGAALVASLLGSWQQEVYFAGIVGNDDFGMKIKKDLDACHVYTNFLETDYDNPTPVSFVLVNKDNGKRTIFEVVNEYIPLKKCNLDFIPDIIYADGNDPIVTRDLINKNQSSISILDAGRYTKDILELCKVSKYIVCSKDFAEEITKMKMIMTDKQTIANVYQELVNKYPYSEIIITLEENGVVYSIDKNIKLMPALKVDTVDTTGAGDIFHGAFTYAIANKMALDDAVRYGIIAAGLSCKKLNAKNSIPTLEEVKIEYEKN